MKRVVVILGVVTVLISMIWSVKAWTTFQSNLRTTRLKTDMDNLFVGLQQFREHVGTWPQGRNAEIAKALRGNNSKRVIILVGSKNEVNSKGEFVDDWGTALRFYFAGDGILIRSAGPNKRFDDSTSSNSDDYFRSN